MKTLTLIRGLPGSGKSTLARGLSNALRVYGKAGVSVIHEADHFFEDDVGNYVFDHDKLEAAHALCQHRVMMAMRNNTASVIVSNTFTTLAEMRPYIDMAEKYEYTVQVVETFAPFESVHHVPQEAMTKMWHRWFPMTPRTMEGVCRFAMNGD